MFVRCKGNKYYLVENKRVGGKVTQQVVKYLGVNPTESNEYLPKLNAIYHDSVQEFLKRLPDNSCDCIIADPPYFISKNRVFTRKEKDLERHFGEWDIGNYREFFESWLPECIRVLKHNLFICTRFEQIQYLAELYPQYYKTTLVWHKTNPAPHFQKNTFISACEPILFFQKKKGLFNFLSVNEMHNFKETPVESRRNVRFHPTQKHEDLIEWLVTVGSDKNGLVLDLFAGSATTSRVAQRLERNFIGVEEDAIYVSKSRVRLKPKDR
jgi:DNA modification methylase